MHESFHQDKIKSMNLFLSDWRNIENFGIHMSWCMRIHYKSLYNILIDTNWTEIQKSKNIWIKQKTLYQAYINTKKKLQFNKLQMWTSHNNKVQVRSHLNSFYTGATWILYILVSFLSLVEVATGHLSLTVTDLSHWQSLMQKCLTSLWNMT